MDGSAIVIGASLIDVSKISRIIKVAVNNYTVVIDGISIPNLTSAQVAEVFAVLGLSL